jgi:adenylate cyclase
MTAATAAMSIHDVPAAGPTPAAEQAGRTFTRAQISALRLVMRVRLLSSVAISLFLLAQFPNTAGLYWTALIAGLALFGWLHYRLELARGGVGWHSYVITALDAMLLTFTLAFPNPLFASDWPVQMHFHYHNAPYFFVFLAFTALGFTPRLVLWMGGVCAACWLAVLAGLLLLPDTITYLDHDFATSGPTGAAKLKVTLDPHFVNISQFIQDAFVIVIVSGILATVVARARGLVTRQISAERERTNLSRYFSPNMVQELSTMDNPLGAVRTQNAAVVFADIVGFTALSEREPPERIIAILRDVHALMAREIFKHDGTVDKYIGDAVMATFGTPRVGPQDAANAIACARGMLDAIDAWNAERTAAGETPIKLGIGVHYGPVVLGDIGDAQRLEFAVIGDTVNVASRIEALTREHGVDALISEQTRAAAEEGGTLPPLREAGATALRGRSETTKLWTFE